MAYSIAGHIIDFTDDPACMQNAEFLALTGGTTEKYASGDLGNADYAVILRGQTKHCRYPVFDKIATVLSAHYFQDRAEQLHPHIRVVAAYHIKKACAQFGVAVPSQVARYAQVDTPLETNVLYLADMPPFTANAPVKTASLERMIAFWDGNYRDMTPKERSDKAAQLYKVAGSLERLPASAVNYVPTTKVGTLFVPAIRQRVRLMERRGDKTAALEYSEIVKTVETLPPEDIATLLSTIDSKHKVAAMYGDVADPYLAVYGRLGKVAKEHDADDARSDDSDKTGLRYKLETLAAEANPYSYHNVLSEAGIREFRKDPVGTFSRLPKIVQDNLLADFEAHLRKHKDMPVTSYRSAEQIERETEALRSGQYPHHPIVEHNRKAHKFPKQVIEKIVKD